MIYRGIPSDPETILTRDHTARALTDSGYAIEVTLLATYASQGQGPAYTLRRISGSNRWRACYRWADALAWAEANRRREVPDEAA